MKKILILKYLLTFCSLLLFSYIILSIYRKIFTFYYYNKNVGRVKIYNLKSIDNNRFSIDTIKYSSAIAFYKNYLTIKDNVIKISSNYATVDSIRNINFADIIYKFLPLLLNLKIAREYFLFIEIDNFYFMNNIFKKIKIKYGIKISLNIFRPTAETKFISIKGKFVKYQPNEYIVNNTKFIDKFYEILGFYPHGDDSKTVISNFLPLNFNVKNDDKYIKGRLKNRFTNLNLTYKSSFIFVNATLYENNNILCKFTSNNIYEILRYVQNDNKKVEQNDNKNKTNSIAKCKINLKNFTIYGRQNINIKRFTTKAILNIKDKIITFSIINPYLNITYNGTNIYSHSLDDKCVINGVFTVNDVGIRNNFKRKCIFYISTTLKNDDFILIKPLYFKLQYRNAKYISTLHIKQLRYKNNITKINLNYIKLQTDTFITSKLIEVEFNLNTNIKVDNTLLQYLNRIKTSSKQNNKNATSINHISNNFLREFLSINLNGKVKINNESSGMEFYKINGEVNIHDNNETAVIIQSHKLKIYDGYFLINNKNQLTFLDFNIDYDIKIENVYNDFLIGRSDSIKSTVVSEGPTPVSAVQTDICRNDTDTCALIKITNIRKSQNNIEILGNFYDGNLFVVDTVQMYNTGGFWRISSDLEFNNINFSSTFDKGIIALPLKENRLSKKNILTLQVDLKRVLNTIELEATATLLPQNEYITTKINIFPQLIVVENGIMKSIMPDIKMLLARNSLRNLKILIDGYGKLKGSFQSVSFLSKFSLQSDFDTATTKFNIQNFKNFMFSKSTNLSNFRKTFEELFDFVNIDGYLTSRSTIEIKDNKLTNFYLLMQFISPVLKLDDVEIENIKIKLPFIFGNERYTKRNKGYIKFSLKNPIKTYLSAIVKEINSHCLNIEKGHIKNSDFNIYISRFNLCFDNTTQVINKFTIQIKNIYINPKTIYAYISNIITQIKIQTASCEVIPKTLTFSCKVLIDLQSTYFNNKESEISIYGSLDKITTINYAFKSNFLNLNLESIMKKFGYDKSLTGLYNLYINNLRIENNDIKELEGYIREVDNSKKEIFSDFIVSVARNIFNIKIDRIKSSKTFNYLGIYFHYIKEKLIIKGLYYKKGKDLLTYNVDNFKKRKTLLKSEGEKDCMIYGRGGNIINICSKGAVILSLDKILKLKKVLLKDK